MLGGKPDPQVLVHLLFCSSIVLTYYYPSLKIKLSTNTWIKVKHKIRTKKKHNQNLIKITHVQYLFQNLVLHFNTLIQNILNPLSPQTKFVILLTVKHIVLTMLILRIYYWIHYHYSQIDIFLYSLLLSGWYCIDTVRRNSVLITHGS